MRRPRTISPSAAVSASDGVATASKAKIDTKEGVEPSTDGGGNATSPKNEKASSSPSKVRPCSPTAASTITRTTSGEDGNPESPPSNAADLDENDASGDNATSNIEPPSTDDDSNDDNEESSSSAGGLEKKFKLYKSPRFKGYLTIALSSAISYHAANISQDPTDLTVVAASDKQKAYAQTVSMVSALISGSCVLCHLDTFSCLKDKFGQWFAPQSKFEVSLLMFLLLWWAIATIVQTG
jgi:hypothetical protein